MTRTPAYGRDGDSLATPCRPVPQWLVLRPPGRVNDERNGTGHDERMATGEALSVAPGSLVVVRDEEWLVTAAEDTGGVWRLEVRGLTELVRGQSAVFFSDLDDIEELAPRNAKLVADTSPRYRRTRLWLEATLRKTPVPHGDPRLAVS